VLKELVKGVISSNFRLSLITRGGIEEEVAGTEEEDDAKEEEGAEEDVVFPKKVAALFGRAKMSF
jgi:hypothetical protein